MDRLIATTLLHIRKENGILMMHRVKKKHDINHDKWIGVGGKLEAGESPEECARREMFEETGLTARNLIYRGLLTFLSDQDDDELIFLYDVTSFEGQVRECEEGVLEWVPEEKIGDLPIWEGDKLMFRYLRECPGPFSLKLSYRGDELVLARETYPQERDLLA